MTIELIIYAVAVLGISLSFMGAMVFAFIAGQAKAAEIQPEKKKEIVIRIEGAGGNKAENKPAEESKEQLERERLKRMLEEEVAQQDKAVEEFIARGGLPR